MGDLGMNEIVAKLKADAAAYRLSSQEYQRQADETQQQAHDAHDRAMRLQAQAAVDALRAETLETALVGLGAAE